ncbi:uncharacterized protein YbbK (DUF523 family) [Archangium gephyra]|uniref:Purine nucleoside phosphorylase n=1 Tax=Archangium gephyra TaxID=48 RepID=A0AAC8QDQ9_9BACT|nr:DUF523 domain-containing protein [Archangium gephyra]AKJ05330.1 Purine nucleoside phosphorylase [Archangium gephyra]REG36018.1 uncharacterized protein YbbK (DUF523 family) [Archangium gephyra]
MTREERLAALREAPVVLVSACLLGEACRYDGKSKGSSPVMRALEGKEVVPVCPETGAGLGIPRPAVELKGGAGAEVLAGRARAAEVESGKDRTEAFRQGAELALAAARRFGVRVAVLKERSPSCGTQGTHVDGAVVRGQGVTAALLSQAGLIVVSDEEL